MKRIVLGVVVLIAIAAMCAGVFAQRGPAGQRQIMLFDRTGKLIKTVGDPGPQGTMTISPDGKKVATSTTSQRAHSRRQARVPITSPHGRQIAAASHSSPIVAATEPDST